MRLTSPMASEFLEQKTWEINYFYCFALSLYLMNTSIPRIEIYFKQQRKGIANVHIYHRLIQTFRKAQILVCCGQFKPSERHILVCCGCTVGDQDCSVQGQSGHQESPKIQIRLSDFGTGNRSVRDDPRKYTVKQQQHLAAMQTEDV